MMLDFFDDSGTTFFAESPFPLRLSTFLPIEGLSFTLAVGGDLLPADCLEIFEEAGPGLDEPAAVVDPFF